MDTSETRIWVDGRSITAALGGDLAEAAAEVLDALDGADISLLSLDLSRVTDVDGRGLELLIALAERAAARGAEVRYRQVLAESTVLDLRDP